MAIFLGLGANLGDRNANLRRALALLEEKDFSVQRVSPVVESPALLPDHAPPEWNLPYLNLVARVSTQLSPEAALVCIEDIERSLGRDSEYRWSPRPIDIDILLWDGERLDTENLRIPHARMLERAFVLTPLVALEPRLTIPGHGGKTVLDFSRELTRHLPLWMGVVNVTPDSFSDGGRFESWSTIEPLIERMIAAGVHIIDVGGESTRPGADLLSADEEWRRIAPVLDRLRAYRENGMGPLVSVDTYHPETAVRALESGVDVVNEVGGLRSREMISVARGSGADWIAMHSLGLPADPSRVLTPGRDPYEQVEEWLLKQLEAWDAAGLDLNRIVFDPGIGFGKNSLQSMQIMMRAGELRCHGLRVLVGHSRKSYMNHLAATEHDKDLLTLGASLNLCKQGVDILRVHNVPLHTAAFRGFSHLER